MTIADLYCRISDDRYEERRGVDRQEQDCRELADRRGWQVGMVHVDNDISAWKRGVRRPGWEAMLARVEAKEIDAIVVYHGDRLIRQPRDLETLLDAADRGFLVTSPSGERDLSNPDHRYILRIEVAGACRESDNTSRRVRRAHEAAAKEGKVGGGGLRPYGYEKDRLTVRDDEAEIIREITRRVLAGEGHFRVAADLQARGVPTALGGRWDGNTIRAMLRRPRIAGLREYQGEIVARAVWPAIIPEDEWRELQAIFEPRLTGAAPRGLVYWLTGIVRCGLCGEAPGTPCVGSPGRRATIRRYGCSGWNGCRRIYRDAVSVESLIGDLLVGWLSAPGRAEQLVEDRHDLVSVEVRARMKADKQMLVELSRRWASGSLSLEEYDAAREVINQRVRDAQRALPAPRARQVQALAGPGARAGWDRLHPEQKRTVADALLEYVVLHPVTGGRRNVFNPAFVEPVWRDLAQGQSSSSSSSSVES